MFFSATESHDGLHAVSAVQQSYNTKSVPVTAHSCKFALKRRLGIHKNAVLVMPCVIGFAAIELVKLSRSKRGMAAAVMH